MSVRPLVIGHRGFPYRFHDNSMEGIEAALALGADGVEIDIRPCGADEWVCHHDRSVEGVPLASLSVSDVTARGLPRLFEVASVVPRDRWLYVEVKPLAGAALQARLGRLREIVGARATHTRVITQSRRVLERLRDALPGIGFSFVFADLDGVLPEGVDLSPHHPLVERLLPLGRRLHPWTVNRTERVTALAAMGVASVTTNRPDLALEVLGGR